MQSTTFDQLKKILVERFAIQPTQITPHTDLQKELNLDSLDAVDLLFAVNEIFHTRIPDQALDNVHTISQLVSLIDKHRPKK